MRDFNLTGLIAGIVFIILGALFLLERLDVLTVSSRYVWPIVLVAVGISIIAGGGRRHRSWRHGDGFRHWHHDEHDDKGDGPTAV